MGWDVFKRSKDPDRAAGREPDALLPALTVSQAGELTRLVHQTLAESGTEGVVSEGAIHLDDGRSYGLHNLSISAAQTPRRGWPALVREHLDALEQINSARHAIPEDDAIFLRLRVREDLGDMQPDYVPLEPFPGIYALAAIDHPTHVEELTGDLERVGGYERAVDLGRHNLAQLPPPEIQRLVADQDVAESEVFVLVSDDFFGASRAIILEHTIREALGKEIPETGVFLVVPNRHLLAVHVPSPGGSGTVAAINALVNLGLGECDQAPGPLSPFVYHVTRDGSAAQVSSMDEDGEVAVRIDGQVADAFIALGLLE